MARSSEAPKLLSHERRCSETAWATNFKAPSASSWPRRRLQSARQRGSSEGVDAQEASRMATRACNLQEIARTYPFHGTCVREVCRGSSDDDFGGPMTPPHAISEGFSPSPSALRCLFAPSRALSEASVAYTWTPDAAPKAPGRATRACNLQGIARASLFHGTCVGEVCRGRADDEFGSPMTPPLAICKDFWLFPSFLGS